MKILRILPVLMALIAAAPASAQQYPDPTRFEEAIRQFEAEDRQTPPPEGAVLLTGSSSIARWNSQARDALAPLTVIPRGFGGSITRDVLHYLDRVVLRYKPRAVLIYEGDNDTGLTDYGLTTEMILDDMNQVVEGIHRALPETRIYILSVKPSVARLNVWPHALEVSRGFRAIAERDPRIFYVDVATPLSNVDGSVMTDIFVEDNLHLNDLGNAIWGSVIKAALMPMEARHEAAFR